MEVAALKSLLEKVVQMESPALRLSPEQEVMANLRDKFGAQAESTSSDMAKGLEMNKPVEGVTEHESINNLRDRFESNGLTDMYTHADVSQTIPSSEIGEKGVANEFSIEKLQQWNDFYCGESNGVKCYRLVSGRDSLLLNGELPARAQIEVQTMTGNSMTVWTDHMGRDYFSRTPIVELADGVRDITQQRKCCAMKDGLTSDDAGHIIAREFGGPSEQINLIPMDSYTNRHGEWRLVEQDIKHLKQAGHEIAEHQVFKYYEGDSKRPSGFDVSYEVDGELYQHYIDNTPTKH